MEAFKLEILAAERALYNGECISIVIPTTQGQYGIWANHANLIAAIIPGMVRFTLPDGKEVIAAVSAGLLKVEKNHVLLLVDTAEHPEEIDENRAKRAAEQAKEAIPADMIEKDMKVKKAMEFGISAEDAFKMSSETPANMLGLKKGRIEVGYDAEFIVLDKNYELIDTLIFH